MAGERKPPARWRKRGATRGDLARYELWRSDDRMATVRQRVARGSWYWSSFRMGRRQGSFEELAEPFDSPDQAKAAAREAVSKWEASRG